MNRRNFFSVLASAVATFTIWPRERSALFGKSPAQAFVDHMNLCPPVSYTGDPDDPRYAVEGQWPHCLTRKIRVLVNGVDRTAEAYECYAGDEGWANLVLKTPEGISIRSFHAGGRYDVIRYGVYGKVEIINDNPDYAAQASELLDKLSKSKGTTIGEIL